MAAVLAPAPRPAAALLALCACLVARGAVAQVRPVTSGMETPAATALLLDDGTALSANPGTLAFSGGLQLDYAYEGGSHGSQRRNQGVFLSSSAGPLAGGFAEEWLHPGPCSFSQPCSRRTTYGVGLRLGQLGIGAARHGFSSDEHPEVDRLSSWDVGAAWRPLECVAAGFAALDVDGPRFGNSDLPRRYLASAAVRPGCEWITVAADATFSSCSGTAAFGLPGDPRACGIGSPDLRFSADLAPFTGVHFLGQLLLQRLASTDRTTGQINIADRVSAQVGLAFDLGHLGLRSAVAWHEADGGRTLFQARLSHDRYASPAIGGRAVLLDLEKALSPPPGNALALLIGRGERNPLQLTLEALHRIAQDSSVAAIVLKAGSLPGSLGHADELRSSIEELRAAGKKVIFYLESAGDLEYYVASSADRVLAAPQAVLAVNGFSSTAVFAAAGLDQLGVKAEFIRVGAYKNAPDTFTRSDMSGEQREVQNAILEDVTARFLKAVAERRQIDEGRFRSLLDKGLLQPQEAVDSGLLDGLVYPDQLGEEVGKLLGRRGRVSLEKRSAEPPDLRDDRWGSRERVVVVRVEGDITLGEGGGSLLSGEVAGSARIARRIRQAADDSGVAAIVVRIDSPGGDGNASDLIWRELVRARKEKGKPVVASMGDVAASGGYYVAVGADAIWAEPSTVTGSIGVFAGHFDASALLARLGVNTVTVKKSESADLFVPNRGLTDTERRTLQGWVDNFYEQFVGRVAEGRKLSREAVDAVGRGRVWTGAQAQQKGLIDHLGGLQEAIVEAKRRAGLAADAEIDLDDPPAGQAAFSDSALAGILEQTGAVRALPKAQLTQALRAISALGEPGTLRARLPVELELR